MKELRKYLLINSIFSFASGIIMIVFPKWLAKLFGIVNALVFPILGINLIVFAGFVWYVSNRYPKNKLLVTIIIVLDCLWVAGSLMIVGLRFFDLSHTGYIITGIVALWIAFLAYKQFENVNRN